MPSTRCCTTRAVRVILVTPTLGRNGGVATHVLAAAAALQSFGHTVVILAGAQDGPMSAAEQQIDYRLVTALRQAGDSKDEVGTVADAAAALAPDIVHLHDVTQPELVLRLQAVAPVVTSAHGYPGCAPNTYYFSPGHECERPHGPLCVFHMAAHGCLHAKDVRVIPGLYSDTKRRLFALRAAGAVVAYSDAVKRNLERNGLDAVTIPLFPTLPGPTGSTDGFDPELLLFAGRLSPAKGLDVLLHALVDTRARLVVCGDGWARPRYEALAHKLGVSDRTQFLGWVVGEQLGELLSRAAAVVVPSVWPEPFGLVGIEAMACGVPAIASRTGGIPEWLDDRATGLLVPPGDARALRQAINELLGNPELRRSFSTEGRTRAQSRFTQNRHVAALERVYGAASEARAGRAR